jgi:type II secretory pathway component PulK
LRPSINGSVLIVVLVVCLGLVSLVLVFGHSMLMAYRGTSNDLAGMQADQAIEGALRYAEAVLVATGTSGEFPDLTTYQSEAVPVGDAYFWFIGRPGDTDAGDKPVFGLVDEASKLSINEADLSVLELLPNMTSDFAAAIIDWRDKDETVTTGGAESETYALRQPGYSSKNSRFESTEELALVNGADMTLLYGEDTNLNGVLDPNEDDGSKTPPDDNSDAKLDAGILNYVTAFSREPNPQTRSDGTTPRIVLSQTAAANQLQTLLTGTFGASRGAEMARNLATGLATSGTTRLNSFLQLVKLSGMTEDEAGQIADAVTVSTSPYILGRVNVNTASLEVLSCIPGIEDKAADVIAARANRSAPATDVSWLAAVLDADGCKKAGPLVTTQSWQVSVDIAAVGQNGRGYRRALFIIDRTGDAPKVVYRRNLSGLGWALGDDARQMLATLKENAR